MPPTSSKIKNQDNNERSTETESRASLPKILLVSYLAIILPALWLGVTTVLVIEDEVRLHGEYLSSGQQGAQPTHDRTLLSFGATLRQYSLPFTLIDTNKVPNEQSHLDGLNKGLKDAHAAVLYGWGVLFVAGSIIAILTLIRLTSSFSQLSAAIERLTKHKLSEQINVNGSADVRDLSAGLESLRVQLNDEERQQQQFLRHISHEIKTPLTSIKEGSKLLDEQMLGSMNTEQQEITQILVKSSTELQSAIENLLAYNSALAPSGPRRREYVNLAELVRTSLDKHELIIKHKELEVRAELEIANAHIDREQILTVFDNLISNAIKHSPRASTINIWLQKKKGSKIGFIVKDQGIGVSAENESNIFTPFFVGEQAQKTTLKGTGLGLSIAKQYVEEHGGDIKLLKSRNGGAFQVTLLAHQLINA